VYILLIILFLLLLASSLWLPLHDIDLWWHIPIGRWIIENREVPTKDLWNAYSEESSFRAYSWSVEVLFAFFEQSFGLAGLMFLKVLLSIILAASLAYCFSKVCKNFVFGLGLTAINIAALTSLFGLRPQCLSWICFTFILSISERIKNQNKANLKELASLFFISMIWANAHITVIFGVACSALWIVSKKNVKLAVTVALACLFGSFITPYLGGEWLTLAGKSNHPFSHTYIKEFQPATLYNVSAAILLLLGILLGFFIHFKPKTLSYSQLFLGIVFGLAAFTIQKFLPYAVIIISMLIASTWAKYSEEQKAFSNLGEGLHLLIKKIKMMPKSLAAIFCVLIAICIVSNAKEPLAQNLSLSLVPKTAVDFIVDNNLPKPLLHGFNEGGYLLYRFSDKAGIPKDKVIIDGRTNVNNSEVVKEFLAAQYAQPKWSKLFERVKPETVIWESNLPLSTILKEKPEWCRVFPTKKANRWSVFVKKGAWLKIKHKLVNAECS